MTAEEEVREAEILAQTDWPGHKTTGKAPEKTPEYNETLEKIKKRMKKEENQAKNQNSGAESGETAGKELGKDGLEDIREMVDFEAGIERGKALNEDFLKQNHEKEGLKFMNMEITDE